MSQNTTPADTAAKPEWEPKPGRVLVLRTSNASRRGYGGFQWPESGPVSAPDWRDDTNCGHGLHGLLWGAGDPGSLSPLADAVWQVVDVAADDIRDLGRKVKFPGGVVAYSGVRDLAVGLVQEHAPAGTPVSYGTATAGDRGTATAGDGGTATAGDRGTATAGYDGTATAGDDGVISILWLDAERNCYRRAIAEVTEDGPVKPGAAYRVENGTFVAVDTTAAVTE